jgi:RNA-directed DNA polymerase
MNRIVDLTNAEAKEFFYRSTSYFNSDLPNYISFEPILKDVDSILKGRLFSGYSASNPANIPNVNYSLISNKDGKLAWRPYELMHPAIYVSLVNLICDADNWRTIVHRFAQFEGGIVRCCSIPQKSLNEQSDAAAQVRSWWQSVEQESLACSLDYSYLLHTDVVDCYGSLYTHSLAWALHGMDIAKQDKRSGRLLGSKIDEHIRSGRYGQTNGIAQGSVLMDLLAELVLGYIDSEIDDALKGSDDCRVLRYRDDYRIFTHSEDRAELILKVISDRLRGIGMRLGVAKTIACRNVVEGSIKPDKLAGIDLQDLGTSNANTIQKQLLRLHSFGQRFPNSGALRRLVSEFHIKIAEQRKVPDDLEVQIAVATDVAFVSPSTIPAMAGILSHLISLAPQESKTSLWRKVQKKLRRIPYNGYMEVWLQRVTQPKAVNVPFDSAEPICQLVNGSDVPLWANEWINNGPLKDAINPSRIVVGRVSDTDEVITPDEVRLFAEKAWGY